MKKKIRGCTVMLTFGSYGGFAINASLTAGFRICLGIVSFAIWFIDIENYIENKNAEIEQFTSNQIRN